MSCTLSMMIRVRFTMHEKISKEEYHEQNEDEKALTFYIMTRVKYNL